MKNLLAFALVAAVMLVSIPAFACGGDDAAKTTAGDETVMTSVDGDKATDAKTTKATKKKKTDAKKDDAETKKTEEEGEV